ncbi:unnamed protein product, partial [Rotaria sp. Silwood1]
MGRGASG